MDEASDEPIHDQPPLSEVPADEQHAYDRPESLNILPRALVISGATFFSAAVVAWKHMDIDFPYDGWQRFLPTLAFVAALVGVSLVFYGVYLTLLEPPTFSDSRFAAWGRFAAGVSLTFVGVVAKNILYARHRVPPPEPLAVAMMCMISGPVLCAWACYGTFVKDRSQRDTGFLMIAALAGFLALLLWA
jgi:hypothetical protein